MARQQPAGTYRRIADAVRRRVPGRRRRPRAPRPFRPARGAARHDPRRRDARHLRRRSASTPAPCRPRSSTSPAGRCRRPATAWRAPPPSCRRGDLPRPRRQRPSPTRGPARRSPLGWSLGFLVLAVADRALFPQVGRLRRRRLPRHPLRQPARAARRARSWWSRRLPRRSPPRSPRRRSSASLLFGMSAGRRARRRHRRRARLDRARRHAGDHADRRSSSTSCWPSRSWCRSRSSRRANSRCRCRSSPSASPSTQAALLAEASGSDLAAPLAGRFLPFAAAGRLRLLRRDRLSLAAGVAALPHLLDAEATVAERRSRAPLGRLDAVLRPGRRARPRRPMPPSPSSPSCSDLVGVGLETLPDWVFAFGKLGLVKICGADAVSAVAAIEACRAAPTSPATLAVARPRHQRRRDRARLRRRSSTCPTSVSALIAAGALAATLAAANAIAFAIASAIGHDLYGGVIDTRASAGRQLIVTRILLVLVIAGGAWLAANRADDVFALALAGDLALGRRAFPGARPRRLVEAGERLRRARRHRRRRRRDGGDHRRAALSRACCRSAGLDPARLGLDELTAAIVGMPLGFLAAVAVSLATPAPSRGARCAGRRDQAAGRHALRPGKRKLMTRRDALSRRSSRSPPTA